jgi:hypothetical protein
MEGPVFLFMLAVMTRVFCSFSFSLLRPLFPVVVILSICLSVKVIVYLCMFSWLIGILDYEAVANDEEICPYHPRQSVVDVQPLAS